MTPTSTADRAAFKPGDDAWLKVYVMGDRAGSVLVDTGAQRFWLDADKLEPAPAAPVAGEAGACEGWNLIDSLDAAYAAAVSPHATEPAGRAMIVAHLRDALLALRAAPAPEVGEAMLQSAKGAYEAVWQWWPDLTAKNVDECRTEAMHAALTAALAGAEGINIYERCAQEALAYGGEDHAHANRAVQWNTALGIAERIRALGTAERASGKEGK